MAGQISPQDFVRKWSQAKLRERASSQEHFIDICNLLGHGTPAELDPDGTWFTFDFGATKLSGEQGFADVWKKEHFGWEYKGKNDDLRAAYDQLLQYRESLLNPPLLIVSDMETIVIHTNFLNSIKRVFHLSLDDLLAPEGFHTLKTAFDEPFALEMPQTAEQVTEEAAVEFAKLAEILAKYGEDPQKTAHFLIRLLFCLFAEDIGILPEGIFTRLVAKRAITSKEFTEPLRALFSAMAQGDWFGEHRIKLIDGGLFDDDEVLELPSDALDILRNVSVLDWSSIEPSVLGTLFERSLDPRQRSQLGAHYTSREDIELVTNPVLISPIEAEFHDLKKDAEKVAELLEAGDNADVQANLDAITDRIRVFHATIAQLSVLDPACGSGNFLSVAMVQLLDVQKELIALARTLGVNELQPSVSPSQFYGIEINMYSHELAEATIWMGYIQWLYENGYGHPEEPILQALDSIANIDAVLAVDESGKLVEPEWPETDVIIGNPPYLGDKKMKAELSEEYVDNLRALYEERLPGQSDYVCYWFEKTRSQIESGRARRAGLLATQGIRGGSNRTALDRIKETGDIFWAESDRNWILDGATVHVSMVGFDDGTEEVKLLDGEQVSSINSDLSSGIDLTSAESLNQNQGISFIGSQKGGAFDLAPRLAKRFLKDKGNPNGRPNSEVVRPWMNGSDIVGENRGMWIIDFGTEMAEADAAQYAMPFEYVREYVKPAREETASEERSTERWWLHQRPRPRMREALDKLSRYIGTPRVSKHRVFVWLPLEILADSQIVVFAREDDYFLGILQSRIHETWARSTGTQLREAESGFRYSPTLVFETFPFPWIPGNEDEDDPRIQAIAEAARTLVDDRGRWQFPDGDGDDNGQPRTLTDLYNESPRWLELDHERLDTAVFDAYGWSVELTDAEILNNLLALNHKRYQVEENE